MLERAKKVERAPAGTRRFAVALYMGVVWRASTITSLDQRAIHGGGRLHPELYAPKMRNDDCVGVVEIGKLEEHLSESLGDGGGAGSLPDLTDSGTMINSSLDQGPVEDEIDQWAYLKRGLIHPFGSFRQ